MAAATEPAMEAEGILVLDQLAFQQICNVCYNPATTMVVTETTIASTATTNTSTATTLLTDLRDLVRAEANFTADIIGNGLHIVATAGGVFSLRLQTGS